MSFGRSDNNGGCIIFSAYHASNALTNGPTYEMDVYEWQKRFWGEISKHRGEPPMPVMIGKKPYWRGVYPPQGVEVGQDQTFVADFDLKIYRVDYNKVRVPNDAEYEKHFKRFVEDGAYVLRKIDGSAGVVLTRRWKRRSA